MYRKESRRMKKRVGIALFLAALACLALLTGCSVFERDISVVLKVDGAYYDSKTITIFQNAILPEPELSGSKFMGWSLKEDWSYGEDGEEALLPYAGLVRYDDVKDSLSEGGIAVLYAAFAANAELPAHDLVVGWYNKPSTSGLTDGIMEQFMGALEQYLAGQGYDVAALDIDVRGYEGNVADMGAAINGDGDVDVVLGVGGNFTATDGANVQALEVQADIPMGGKSRSIARLTEKELATLVYQWLQTADAQAALAG